MSKFKVGELVRVKNNAREITKDKFTRIDWDDEMDGMAGAVGAVMDIDSDGDYRLDGTAFTGVWWFIESALEPYTKPLKSKPEIIFMDDNKLKVVFAPPYAIVEYKHRSINFKARATCNPEDTYDKFEGFRLAMGRLKEKMWRAGYVVKF